MDQQKDNKTVFYHYASLPFDELLTLREQTKRNVSNVTKEELTERDSAAAFRGYPGSSADYVCFLFEPAPIDLIAGKYPADHQTWAPGKKIWELTVELTDIDDDIPFFVSESKTAKILSQLLWPGDSAPAFLKNWYFKLRTAIAKRQGEIGEGTEALHKIVKKYTGATRAEYANLLNSKEFNKIGSPLQQMYAPYVPHIMLWPISGSLVVKEKKEIIIPK